MALSLSNLVSSFRGSSTQTPLLEFTYDPLSTTAANPATAADTIRVLHILPATLFRSRIACNLSTTSLSSPHAYTALSYTWGDPESRENILLNGRSLSITQNLATAIRHLRDKTAEKTVWIDQVCINQADHVERAKQVKLMARIYGQAASVVIWLGDENTLGQHGESTIQAKKVFTLMRRLLAVLLPRGMYREYGNDVDPGAVYDSVAPDRLKPSGAATVHDLAVRRLHIDELPLHGLPSKDNRIWLQLANVFSRPWLSRVWVIQEAVVADAQTTLVQCAHETISWKDLVKVAQVAYVYLPRMLLGMELAVKGWPIEHVRDFHKIKKARKHGIDPGLCTMVLRHKAYGATDPRDKLYAMANMTAEQCGEIDYTINIDDLSHQLAFHLIKRHVMCDKDLSPNELQMLETHFPEIPHTRRGRLIALLCSAGTSNQRSANLPSWVPDLAVSSIPTPIWKQKRTDWSFLGGERLPAVNFQEFGSGTEGLPRELCVDGQVCDTVKEVGSHSIQLNGSLDSAEKQDELAAWFLEASRMAFSVHDQNRASAATDEEMTTLLGMGRQSQEFFSIDEVQGMDLRQVSLDFSEKEAFRSQMCHRLSRLAYLQAIPNIQGRAFFTTTHKRIGVGPVGTRQGDAIVLFCGFESLVVLCPAGDNMHSLVGECHLGAADLRTLDNVPSLRLIIR